MKIKKSVYAIVLTAALSSLFMNRAFAYMITVFAPSNYAGVAPSYPRAFGSSFSWCTPGSFASIDPFRGGTLLTAKFNASYGYGCAISRFDTGWWHFNKTTQAGSVHADTYLWYSINASGASVSVHLSVYEWNGTALEVWTKRWSSAVVTTGITTTVDLGINPSDLSRPGNKPFRWTNCSQYYTRIQMQASTYVSNAQAIIEGKYDDALWIAYFSSPGVDWVNPNNPNSIELNPSMGPVGTEVVVNGTGFAPESQIYVYCDNKLLTKTLSDGNGNFTIHTKIPPEMAKGPHVIRAIDQLENMARNCFEVFIPAPSIAPYDINEDGIIDIEDIYLVALQYGKTDPNVDPPETGGATDLSTRLPTLASIAAVSIGLFGLRKRKRG